MSAFSAGNFSMFFFLCFLTFYELQCLFYKNHFVSTFIIGIFCFILAGSGLKTKLKKCSFFLPTSDKSAIKKNSHMQLCSIFHKARKAWKFQSHSLSGSSAIRKSVTGMGGQVTSFSSCHYFHLYT